MKHRHHRKHIPALSVEGRASVRRLYFRKRWTQVRLAIHFHIAQSTVSKYVSERGSYGN
jgi:predicted transcriptional regulator